MFYHVLVTLLLLVVISSCGSKTPRPNQEDVPQNPNGESRIIGGDLVNIEDYPYMAGYDFTSKSGFNGFCGGAILTDQFIVTAANCVDEVTDPSTLTLRVGNSNREEGTIVPVRGIIIHPDYIEQGLRQISFNVAMLNTEPIEFGNSVQPVNLPEPKAEIPSYVTVTGWGTTERGGKLSTHLRGVELETLDFDHCLRRFYPFITMDLFCAGGHKKGICAGDDGSPAVQTGGDGPKDSVLIGIAVFQRGCGSEMAPAAFMNVPEPDILDFITETIGEANDINN